MHQNNRVVWVISSIPETIFGVVMLLIIYNYITVGSQAFAFLMFTGYFYIFSSVFFTLLWGRETIHPFKRAFDLESWRKAFSALLIFLLAFLPLFIQIYVKSTENGLHTGEVLIMLLLAILLGSFLGGVRKGVLNSFGFTDREPGLKLREFRLYFTWYHYLAFLTLVIFWGVSLLMFLGN